jgi:AcrR family transcriptional regulator
VLTATTDELADRGLANLSLDSVARRAGVHKSTIYRRWGTRDRLILELLREQAAVTVPVPDTGSLRQDLIELARAAVANAASPVVEPIIRAVISELPHDTAVADTARQFWEERMSLDGEIIKRAIARGEIAPNTDPRAAIEAILGPLQLRLLITGEPANERTITNIVDLLLGGLAEPTTHKTLSHR